MTETTGTDTDEDAAAIEKTLTTLLMAFATNNADDIDTVYTDDAEWTNAFGHRLKGRRQIADYLAELFADPRFTAGSATGMPEITVQELADTVVAVWVRADITGQETADGGQLGLRHNHSLKVLTKCDDGRWLVCSDLYMDARTEVTHAT
ncbi:SgcJ/EcaC family oxidoreductase [Tomitella gaofuii]|uniref:SgcJ/EcaC family oxidoreductase n=1 Tax=Tomitella gaofuii TaxID=2760083 RepID=UPI0015F8E612|nr:SgcJ/EcaC family oxidoreductase [Tomitella gaofuii]